ncbi:hypothetical protein JOC54_003084 [Alkalihalobacillus xiaoxiensis]|uniref:DUF262 domain-containing protein n=1 Tax=Shouchella xiaoxiensis TaxID=766895 RepID=A0ABS2SWD0_9BACI|nr:DUF262 domain-containing protein [Shouchella xiaoxiensis]MBM7839804.1 hypothetical protein [Shouchella xiaoxiensis]
MNTILSEKRIVDLMESAYSFFIPSYQRGYRWTKVQVTELLDDLWEFHQLNPKKDDAYWLQPIIVKQRQEHWEVIDGQQRLTTIAILLQTIKKALPFFVPNMYSMIYETREKSADFLAQVSKGDSLKDTNIDFYHMHQAYKTITAWFMNKPPEAIMHIAQRLREQVKVLWYEVEPTDDAIDLFARINIGKIPLTNAELIKALFLSRNHLSTAENDQEWIRLKQLEIAGEWDRIEYRLQDDSFWYFLHNDTEADYQNRIEWLFELVTNQYEHNVEDDVPYYTFHVFSEYLENESRLGKNRGQLLTSAWQDIQQLFMKMTEWYENRELYHYIGYLRATKTSIHSLLKLSLNKKKDAFVQSLKQRIAKSYDEFDISALTYSDKQSVRRTLLLFNILTLQNDAYSNTRFDFERFKNEKWDIEHIHSVNAKLPTDRSHQIALLNDAIPYLSNQGDLIKRIDDFNQQVETEQDFEVLYSEITRYFGDNQTNSIGNLTLLDSSTNRSYQNALFPIKRQTLINRDRTGTYIPIGTRNVFLKYYSRDVNQMNHWGPEDQTQYIDALLDELSTVIPNVKEGVLT